MNGFRWGPEESAKVSVLAYADDIVLVSGSKEDLQALVNVCERYFDDVRLKVNIKESGVFGLHNPKETVKFQVKYGNMALPQLLAKDYYKYLGKHVSVDESKRPP